MTTAAIRFTTDGDLYVANALALQIDSKGAQLIVQKSVDKTVAEVGEAIGYTLQIKNTGSIRAETVSVQDLLPNEAELIAGSITIDGVPYGGALPVTFGPLNAGATAVVKFSVRVNSLPVSNPIFNIAQADYTFIPFPGNVVTSSSDSNYVAVYIVRIVLDVVKSVDKAYAVAGETLTYTSVVTNHGNLPLTNVRFTDPIPAGTSFIAGSVTVNGVSFPAYNPSVGFPLPSLVPAQSAIVTFQVQINP